MPGFIPWKKVDLQLQSHRSIWISTTRPDGRPHSVPVWYWWDGDKKAVYFAGGKKTQKARNLAHQQWAVIHAGDGDDVIILEGVVRVVTDPAELERVNSSYMEKYVDPHSGAQAEITNPGDNVYRLDVLHLMTWEYGTVGSRTDWNFGDNSFGMP